LNELTCSAAFCGEELTGQAVLLYDTEGESSWGRSFETYVLQERGGDQREVVIIHPRCFQVLFDEMQKQEIGVTLQFVMGSCSDMREALVIP
jgi:hypothetical protein